MAALGKLGPGALRVLALVAVGVLAIAAFMTLRPDSDQKILEASFPRTVSIYEGSEVRVLGVPVGTITSVEPAGTTVKVTMEYDPEVKVPADVKAAVVAPSVVGDRYIQLTPVYTKGAVLEDGAKLGTDRTAIPLELDEIYQSLDDIAVALGPDGANKEGALTRLLQTTAENFGGQGEQFNETIRNLSQFTSTLDNNKDALFDTASEIERFVGALEENDQTVRDFNDSLAAASSVLEGERDDLAAALRNLGIATEQVSSFVKENEQALSENVTGLVRLTDILVKQRDAIDETLSAAPTALSNLYHTYNPETGTLDTRANLGQNITEIETNPVETLCSLVAPIEEGVGICDELKGVLGRSAPGAPDRVRTKPVGKDVVVVEKIDTSLGGILEVQR
jgi:phospholipid/cholesterol/gamma-HCH transport system substrate-binding protein